MSKQLWINKEYVWSHDIHSYRVTNFETIINQDLAYIYLYARLPLHPKDITNVYMEFKDKCSCFYPITYKGSQMVSTGEECHRYLINVGFNKAETVKNPTGIEILTNLQ